MDSYIASNGSYFMVTWAYFENHLLKVGLNPKPWDHDTSNTHNHCFYSILSCARTCMNKKTHRNSIRLRARSHMASHYNSRVHDHTTWLLEASWTAFGHFSFGIPQFHGHGPWLMCDVALSWGPGHIWLHTTTWGPRPHYMMVGGALGRPLVTFLLGSYNSMVTALVSRVTWP
jgi:hypothetical protein